METKFVEASIEKAADGTFRAIASTNAVDRHGEIVDNNGWDFKAFKKNPVILWAHDHTEPAIGVAKKVFVDGVGKKAKLMLDVALHDLTPKAAAIKALVEAGIINSLSVGFKPIESPDGVTFTKNELLEVSMVNVPANGEAMIMAYKSLKDAGVDSDVMKEVGISGNLEVLDMVIAQGKDIDNLKEMAKAQPVKPPEKTETVETRQRLSSLKVIARASDKLLESHKKQEPIDNKVLLKVIKRATQKLIVAEKEQL